MVGGGSSCEANEKWLIYSINYTRRGKKRVDVAEPNFAGSCRAP